MELNTVHNIQVHPLLARGGALLLSMIPVRAGHLGTNRTLSESLPILIPDDGWW